MKTSNKKLWWKGQREKHSKENKARHRANEVYKEAQPCSMDGCGRVGERHHPDYDKPEEIIWLCIGHHKRLHYPNTVIGCIASGCVRPHHSKGRCKLHYNRWRREDREYYKKELERNRNYSKK